MNINNIDSMALRGAIFDQVNIGIFAVNPGMEVVLWNNFMEINSGMHAEDIIGRNLFECFPALPEKWLARKINNVFLLGNFSFTSWEQRPYLFEFAHNCTLQNDVKNMLQDSYFYPVKGENGDVESVCVSILDVTEIGVYQNILKKTIDKQKDLIMQLKETQNQLQQSEKMAAVGQLAAGVAHEINNPVAFVASNLRTLNTYIENLLTVVDRYENAEKGLEPNSQELALVNEAKEQTDFEFLKEDLGQLLAESDDGLARVRRIVQGLKDFSRPDSGVWDWSDLHQGLESTLNVVNNEIKYKAEVIKEYAEIPQINCNIAQLNQVFMNLIINAAQAIEEHGAITIRTGKQDDMVWVEVSDTGKGIDKKNIKQIFNPFFTTKPVGKGTGLGLSISYGIVEKHKGRMEVESELEKGTTFRVWLPIEPIRDDVIDNDKRGAS